MAKKKTAAKKRPAKQIAPSRSAAKKTATAGRRGSAPTRGREKTATRESDRGKISLTRIEDGAPVRISVKLRFSPEEIGPERERMIYDGIGRALAGALEEEEKPKFLEQLESARNEAGFGAPAANAGSDSDDDDEEDDSEEDDLEDEGDEEDGDEDEENELADDGR